MELGEPDDGEVVPGGRRAHLERLERLIRQGQASGDFDRKVSSEWLMAVMLALANAAGEEVKAGRMSIDYPLS